MNKDVQNKIASCKALQGATVADICATARFRENLAAYLTAQREDRKQIKASYEAMRKVGGAKGYKLPSHVIDHLSDLSVAEFANAYMEVINYYLEQNSYYTEKEPVFKTSDRGRKKLSTLSMLKIKNFCR